MKQTNFARIACAFLCLLTTPIFAQYTIKKIVFEGSTPYPQAALEAASGLKPGDALSQETLQQAAQKLVDTGAFEDLQVTLEGAAKAISVVFKIKPLDPAHQLTATFDNLIWFTPEELTTGLKAHVPLYSTILPESGTLQDAVQTALASMLQEKNVTGTLDHQVYEPSAERPLRIVAYRVKQPSILLHGVHLTGVTTDFGKAINESAGKVVGKPFNEGIEHLTTADALLTPYLTAGYLDARLSGRTLAPISSTPDRIEVDLSATVEPGAAFHISELTWAGSPQLSSADFTSQAPLHPGDPASTVALAKSVDLLATAYHKEGFNDALVLATPAIDKSAGRVSYAFTVTPGQVYHVRSVTPVGVTPAQQADYTRAWHLKPGDIYNPEYIRTFLKQNTALRSFDGYTASYKTISDPETHLVDVTVTFIHGASITAH